MHLALLSNWLQSMTMLFLQVSSCRASVRKMLLEDSVPYPHPIFASKFGVFDRRLANPEFQEGNPRTVQG